MCLQMVQKLSRREENTEDESRLGRPSTCRTPEMIEKVRQMLAQDRRLTLRLSEVKLGVNKDTAHTIFRDDLGKQKICTRFVPHKLTDEQKAKWMGTSGDFISMCDQDPFLLENIVTGDETWCYQFDPESKRQSMAWCSPTSPRPKKVVCKNPRPKHFFDNKGIIHMDFFPLQIKSLMPHLPGNFEPITTAWCSQISPRPKKSRLQKSKAKILLRQQRQHPYGFPPLQIKSLMPHFTRQIEPITTAWCSQTSPRPKKSRLQKSKAKTLLR